MLDGATIYFYCLFDESRFSRMIMEWTELNWLCKHYKKDQKQPSSHYCSEMNKIQFLPLSIEKKSPGGVLLGKVFLKKIAKFRGKPLCPRPAALLKKRLWHRCFHVNWPAMLLKKRGWQRRSKNWITKFKNKILLPSHPVRNRIK